MPRAVTPRRGKKILPSQAFTKRARAPSGRCDKRFGMAICDSVSRAARAAGVNQRRAGVWHGDELRAALDGAVDLILAHHVAGADGGAVAVLAPQVGDNAKAAGR